MENTSAMMDYQEEEWIYVYEEYYYNASCEGNVTAKFTYLESLKGLKTGILWSYLVTMIVGLFGNSLVIYIIARNSQIRNKSVANYYIWNLALADLFFVLMMPLFCYSTYCEDWPFGTPICKLSRVFFEINRYASMFTLVALSFDRYLASFYNMAHLRTVKAGVIVCCVIWILCAIISTPYWIYTDASERNCRTVFPTNVLKFWTFFQLIIALLVPLILICVSYILLALRLQMILSSSSARSSSIQKPSRKMMRTVLVVVVLFLICQVPWHAHEIIALKMHLKYDDDQYCMPTIPDLKLTMYLNTTATILVFISSCCNPIVYGILNDNYRKEYMAVLRCCCYRRVRISSGFSFRGSMRASRRSSNGASSTVVPSTYRLHIAFHRPCCNSDIPGLEQSRRGHKLSLESQDGTQYHGAATEHIELDDQSEKVDVAVQHDGNNTAT